MSDFILYGVDLDQPCTKYYDGVREYSGNETLKNLKAYQYETRSEVAVVGSPEWSLATQTEIPDLQDIAKNFSFQVNPMVYLKHYLARQT